MRLQRQSNKQIITLDITSTLGQGGEARIYPVPQDETLVAKIYHKPISAHADKLAAMLANPPENPTSGQGHISIAWPVDLLHTTDGSDRVVGFLMPRVNGMNSMLEFYNPKSRRQKCPFFNYLYLHRSARNLAAAVGALHARGYCIGDVNESNILVGNTALVTLVDTDSFQVREPDKSVVYRCRVGKAEFTPPELQGKSFHSMDREIEHDLFGLAVLIFQLLMEGTHPFSGIFQGVGDPPPYEARIAAGHFVYSVGRRVPYLSAPVAPAFKILHPTLQQLFVRCFEDGHNNPSLRPTAQLWQAALREAETDLIACSLNNQHRYGKHLNSCPWCERTVRLLGRDPFPSWQAVKKGQHLQPLKTKRVTAQKKYQPLVKTPAQTKLPLLTSIPIRKTKKSFNPFVLSLLGIGVLGLLEVIVIVHNLKFATEISAKLLPKTNDSIALKLTNDSRGFEFYSNQGKAYSRLGDYEGAIASFTQALLLNPNDVKSYVNRGNAYYEIAQRSGDPDKDYKGAIEDFNRALRLNPAQVEAYVGRGMVRFEVGQYSKEPDREYKKALEDLDEALRRNPDYAKAYVHRGVVRYRLAQHNGDSNKGYNQAIEDFNQALRLNPQEAEAYIKRGILRYELEQYSGDPNLNSQGAVEDLQKAAKLFLDQGDMEHYQQALGNICVALENNCDLFLQNSKAFVRSEPQPFKGERQGN